MSVPAKSAVLRARERLAPLAERLGVTSYNLQLLESMRRTEWLYRSRGRVPSALIECLPASPVGEREHELCRRLIDAYRAAGAHDALSSATDGMWSWIFDSRQRTLADTLQAGDPQALAELLASMFQQEMVLGMAAGSLIGHARSRLGGRVWSLKSLDGLVSLAEALGVVAVENPEQGGAGVGFAKGAHGLFSALERELGFRLDFPAVGAPCGPTIEGRLITPDTPDQVYAAVRLDRAIALHLDRPSGVIGSPRIVEIGGGYGGMCYWLLKCREALSSYTIVDLPIVNVIHGYFLACALGAEQVAFYGEPPALINVLPNFALAEVQTPFDVLVNKDSMPEMPREAMIDYLQWGAANCEGIFYSYNQEAAAEFNGELQGVVHDGVREVGGFERLRRDESWVRRGYVEEVYVAGGRASAERSL